MEERKITLSLPHLPILLEIQSEAGTSNVDTYYSTSAVPLFFQFFLRPQIKNEMKMLTVRDSHYPHKKVEERERENKSVAYFLFSWNGLLC